MNNLDVWYSHSDIGAAVKEMQRRVDPSVRKRAEANLAKARTRDSVHSFDKLTQERDGERRFISDPPLIERIDDLVELLRGLVRGYRRTLQSDRRHLLEEFRVVDIARKVVGVGSVGTRSWVLLLLGRDGSDPLFLQAKEAQPSVLEEFVGRPDDRSHGERVVRGQHLMQAASDIFLGWETISGIDGVQRDFYIRQLRDWKGAALVETMAPDTMGMYATICAGSLARAHARSGDRIAIASYLGGSDAFDQALAEFAEAYADQNARDYDALVQAEQSGRLAAHRGT